MCIRDRNNCIAPTRGSEIVEYGFTSNQIVEPDPIGTTIGTTQPIYDPQGLWQTCYYTGVFVPELKTYEIEITGTARATENKVISGPPALSPNKVDMNTCSLVGNIGIRYPDDVSGWPEGQTTTSQFTWSAQYNITVPSLLAPEKLALIFSLRSSVPADESQIEFINTDIKIYEL